MAWVEKWDGGRVGKDAHGKKHYVIRRRVGGRAYEVGTRATTMRGAMDALKRFEADPERARAVWGRLHGVALRRATLRHHVRPACARTVSLEVDVAPEATIRYRSDLDEDGLLSRSGRSRTGTRAVVAKTCAGG